MDIVIVSSEIKAEARKEIKDHKTGEISYGQDPLKKIVYQNMGGCIKC